MSCKGSSHRVVSSFSFGVALPPLWRWGQGWQCLAGPSVLRDGCLVPVPDSALPLFRYPVLLRRSGVLASGSGLAASTCIGVCGRCLRITLGPGADFPFISLPCGRVVLMGQRLVIVSSPLGGCVSFTPFWLGSVASALSLSESWLFFLLWICQCYCRIQWRRPSRKLLRFP